MKKIFLLIGMMSLAILSFPQDQQITPSEASRAAITWLKSKTGKNMILVVDIKVDTGDYGNVLYEVKTSIDKTVLLSGSRACLPILGVYNGSKLKADSIPCGLAFMFDYYRERIDSCLSDKKSELYYGDEWRDLIKGNYTPSPKGTPVSPLTTSKWSQRRPKGNVDTDAYNYEIEAGSGCNHCLVGCVAVAMGQLMYYWQYPVVTKKYVSQFDWCNMTDELDTVATDYELHRDAIAYLLSKCGKAVGMDYGCEGDGSSAETLDVEDALQNKFGFSSLIEGHRKLFYPYFYWKNMVISDLYEFRPVIYAGYRELFEHGHSFICDGYDGDDLFHFNWGWGEDTPEDWYTLRCPSPYPDRNYKFWQRAIFHATPAANTDICDMNLLLDDFYSNNSLVALGPHVIVPQTMTTLTSASVSSPASWRTIPSGAMSLYRAHEEVILQDGFEAEYGSEFIAWIEPCTKCDEANNLQGGILSGELDVVGDQPDTTSGTVAYAMGQPHELPSDALFPNPTDGPLTLATDGMAQAVFVYTLSGNPVGGWRMNALTETSLSLDVSALAPGVYLLSVTTPNATTTAKFIRR